MLGVVALGSANAMFTGISPLATEMHENYVRILGHFTSK